jgi:hypothetical protein
MSGKSCFVLYATTSSRSGGPTPVFLLLLQVQAISVHTPMTFTLADSAK